MKIYILFLFTIITCPAFAQQDNLPPNQEEHLLQKKIEELKADYSQIADSNSNLKNKVSELEYALKVQNSQIVDLHNKLETDVSDVKQEIFKLKGRNREDRKTFNQETEKLSTLINFQERKIDSLEKLSNQNSHTINQTAEELGIRIQKTGDSSEQKYAALGSSLSQNKTYGLSAMLALALLSVLGFVLLRRRAGTDKSQLAIQIQDTKKQIEEEGIKLDSKLVGILETQLKLMSEERASTSNVQEETDHSLALKVADEIVRIEKNLGQMDEGTKGLKQLGKAVDRIKDNFAANGYEMVDLLGKPYQEGIKASVSFRPDDELKEGEQLITRVLKPQVNFRGVMIQQAQIEVSQG